MSRIATRFAALKTQGRCALIPYFAAGDPSPSLTVPLMLAAVRAGADLIELGVPFSDPMADGPVVQRATERAIAQGVGLTQVLSMVQEFRTHDAVTPVVLMGYANPIERMGTPVFCREAQVAGVDGVLVVDLPPEECREFTQAVRDFGIDQIFLLAPTSTDARVAAIAERASGYVYYVSLRGTTGAAHLDIDELQKRLPTIRSRLHLPLGVGFGIRDAATAAAVGKIADAVVIGSRIIEETERVPPGEAVRAIEALLHAMRVAMDAGRRHPPNSKEPE